MVQRRVAHVRAHTKDCSELNPPQTEHCSRQRYDLKPWFVHATVFVTWCTRAQCGGSGRRPKPAIIHTHLPCAHDMRFLFATRTSTLNWGVLCRLKHLEGVPRTGFVVVLCVLPRVPYQCFPKSILSSLTGQSS